MNEFIQNITPIQMTGVLLLLAVIAHFALGVILKQIKKHTGGTKTQIDDYLINSLSAPLKLLIWYGWIYFSLHELKVEIQTLGKVVEYIDIAPIFILTWGILRLISSIESFMLEKEGNVDKDSVRLFTRLIKIVFVFAIVLGVAQYFGYSVSSILTLGGVGGIVVGFAAKDMLANVFGGLMIQMDKPFSTGDWIRTTDKSIEGVVEKIGWRMTRLRTFNKNPIYVPNGIFATIPIETPSRMTNREISAVIGIRYEDIKGKLLLDVADIIAEHGAEIAYPTQTLHIQKPA